MQKKTGMIFQEFNLVNNLSAINNVLTGLLNSSSKFLSMFYLFTKEQKLEALKALETVGLLNKSYNRADELSGGQRQRVGIARAIIKKPTLLLADEPVASLDPKAADIIMSLLKKINQQFNITVICNLHQVELASQYSDRIVGLLDGEILFNEQAKNVDKFTIKKYIDKMQNNILKLEINNKTKHLEKYIKPQWTWRTYLFLISLIAALTFTTIDLEINFIELFTDSSKYFGDILARMSPPDFSNFKKFVISYV